MSMKRMLAFAYGAASYAISFATFLYAFGFVGGFVVPKTIDSPMEGSLGMAVAVNLALLALFATQHSVMARPAFKRWLEKFVPTHLERSTYVLFSSLAMIVMFWQWRSMGGAIWDIQQPAGRIAMYALFGLGWLAVLVSTFLINHFDLFRLRQVWLYLQGKEYTSLPFKTPWVYSHVRHPLYVGWILASWMTPTMTVTHLFYAIGITAYILIAIQFEERDLLTFHPEYDAYRKRVPMLIPRFGRATEKGTTAEDTA